MVEPREYLGLGKGMETTIIDGKQIAAAVLDDVRADMAELAKEGKQPGLAVVLVGSDPASQAYVGSKERTCNKLGMFSRKEELPEDTTQEALLALIEELNQQSGEES